MIKNKKMKELIEEFEDSNYQLTPTINILNKFNPKFIEWDGCILLKLGYNLDDLPEKFQVNNIFCDRTQLEATYNHIHLSDVLPELEENPKYSLRIAIEIMKIWEHKLKTEFPKEKFHIVISHDEFGSVVRFYKIRPLDIPWVDIDNIDKYKEEAILVKEI
ncbi:hypothetical protein CLHUN_42580 [Ruminiclostridium hungatei]|uniref:Uncharacterized protein n=1 Tax=Ruminiclostridium hungatei TaxID=48256 RepID=A0A1V4SF24_RUMHU|nr:hypothetical protein [Ruminiclostridium hungatei]OPX41867.1 hypothetical protein CLHUN_42580 [Ruminiclostridium hungatei]